MMVDVSSGRLLEGDWSARSMIVGDDMCCVLEMVVGDFVNPFIMSVTDVVFDVTVGAVVIGEDMLVLSVGM